MKIKQQEEKKKKKLKSKRKGSLGECTDEEYDEQTFVEEIKQLPKRNRHAPRRYVSKTFYLLCLYTQPNSHVGTSVLGCVLSVSGGSECLRQLVDHKPVSSCQQIF